MAAKVNFNILKAERGRPRILANFDEREMELSPLWLRERCQDKTHLDERTKQRLFNPHNLPDDLEINDARMTDEGLLLSFSDGYQGIYELDPLQDDFDENDSCPVPTPWKPGTLGNYRFDWHSLADVEHYFSCLECFLAIGFVVIENTPVSPLAILDIAKRFGSVRDTNFGHYFEVYARPNPEDANDLAYTALRLDPHTDNPYRDPVPGIQLLHCLVNKTSGGLSTLVDGLSVTDELKKCDPEGFRLLSTVPIRYRFWDRDVELVGRQPMICCDSLGKVTGIHYSPKLDHLPLLPIEEVRAYHRARSLVSKLLVDPEFELRFALQSGEVVMFDNNRILHGRTSFDSNVGHRHLQGCYIDRDQPKSSYRVIRRRLGR